MFRILCGEFQPGESLPTIQNMAIKNEISQNVMRRVIAELIKKGVVTRRWHGRNVYITTNMEHLARLKEMEVYKMTAIFCDKMHLLGYDTEGIKKEIETVTLQGKEG